MARPLVPRALLDKVVKYFKPQSVILFGSRARSKATRDSDIDLLVIVDDDTPPERLTWKAGFDSHPSFTGAADVFPIRAETFERERGTTGTLAAEADTDGIVVYGSPKGSAWMRPVDPASSGRPSSAGSQSPNSAATRRLPASQPAGHCTEAPLSIASKQSKSCSRAFSSSPASGSAKPPPRPSSAQRRSRVSPISKTS